MHDRADTEAYLRAGAVYLQALGELRERHPDRCRAYVMKERANLSGEEIARALEVTTANAWQLVSRGRSFMRGRCQELLAPLQTPHTEVGVGGGQALGAPGAVLRVPERCPVCGGNVLLEPDVVGHAVEVKCLPAGHVLGSWSIAELRAGGLAPLAHRITFLWHQVLVPVPASFMADRARGNTGNREDGNG